MLRCILILICLAALAPSAGADSPDFGELRGRVIYLEFWASWCGPCKQAFPWMQTLKNKYENQGLTIVAVNLDADHSDAERFLQQFNPTFEVRFDPKGKLAESFKVEGMPASVLIDRRGTSRFTHVGFRPIDGSVYEAQVRKLLAEK